MSLFFKIMLIEIFKTFCLRTRAQTESVCYTTRSAHKLSALKLYKLYKIGVLTQVLIDVDKPIVQPPFIFRHGDIMVPFRPL